MTNISRRSRLLKSSVLLSGLLIAVNSAFAQTAPSPPTLSLSSVASGSGYKVSANAQVSDWGTANNCFYNQAVIYTEFFDSSGASIGYVGTADGYPAASKTIPYSGTYTARSQARSSCYWYSSYSSVSTITLGKSCTFGTQTITSGSSVTAYRLRSVYEPAYCDSPNNMETITCRDGVLSGTFTQATCVERCKGICR